MDITLKFEGTLEELAPFFQALQAAKTATTASLETNQQAMADEPGEFVTSEFLRRALKRHPLSDNTVAFLTALGEAEEKVYLSRATLREKIRAYTGRQEFTDQQLTGVIGSYGKRLHQTEGYNGASYFEYQKVKGEWHYRLPDELRDVVRNILRVNTNR